jgi:RNA polymerase sigma-70 factor (ECF subfamily)
VPELSDEKYMDQLRGGQFDAMTVLFGRYQTAIYRYFFKQSFDSSISQELTQQVFVRAFEKRDSFSGREGMFRPWLYRIARNLWLDHVRVAGPKNKKTVELTGSFEVAHIQEKNFTEEDFKQLDRAIKLLPEELKEPIILSKYQQLKYAEIARIMDISEAAVKTRIHRAIKTLREIYFDKTDK